MQQEIWAKCSLLPDHYEVSNLGNVRYWKDRAYYKKATKETYDGYLEIRFSVNSKKKYARLSRCIAFAFIPNPNKLQEVNHINYNKLDNSVINLEWIGGIDNIKHGLKRRQKIVYQYTIDGQLVKIHESQQEAHTYLGFGNVACIHQCVRGTIKTAYGFVWSEKELEPQYFNKLNCSHIVRIERYNKNGELLQTYRSLSEANKYGFSMSGISDCINGRQKTHRKFIWRRHVCSE